MAEGGISPGEHWTVELAGMTFNMDTILATAVAGGLVAGTGLWAACAAGGPDARLVRA